MIDEIRPYKLYVHTVPKEITGHPYDKYYVGIAKDIVARWGHEGNGYNRQVFYNAIQKYGWNNIKHEIVCDALTEKEAIEKEKEMIIKLDSFAGRHGYNLSFGEHGNRRMAKLESMVYCLEENRVYRNTNVASTYTGIPYERLRRKCIRARETFDYERNGDYFYCYLPEYYKIYNLKHDKRIAHNSGYVVYLKNNKIYPSVLRLNEVMKLKINRQKGCIGISKYLEYLKKGKNVTKYALKLRDYLTLYEYAEMED